MSQHVNPPAANATEQVVLDFFAALSTGELDAIRPYITETTVWEPMVKDIPGAGKYVGNDIIDVFLAPVRGMFKPGDPKVNVDTIFSGGSMVAVESHGSGQLADGREYANRYSWVVRVKDGKIDQIHEYMDSHYVANLFGL